MEPNWVLLSARSLVIDGPARPSTALSPKLMIEKMASRTRINRPLGLARAPVGALARLVAVLCGSSALGTGEDDINATGLLPPANRIHRSMSSLTRTLY